MTSPRLTFGPRLAAAVVALSSVASFLAPPPAWADQRVVHGVVTAEHPAVGALLLAYDDGSLYQDCSGALIGCRHVLTAAHCVCLEDTADDCTLPDPDDSVFYLQHGGLFGVSAVEFSPNYDFGVRGDVAVLTLDRDVERVVPLPINTARRVPDGTPGTVVGFGVTSDNASDAGLKRSGTITTAPCPSDVPDRRHVCWLYEEPSGPAGSNSSTCYGDSGSPLIVDIGNGAVAAGVDSGLNGRCVKNTEAFDASVFDNRSFIASVAGADLGAARCGDGLAHVGDPGVAVAALDGTLGFGRNAGKCRKAAARATAKWTAKAYEAHRKCLAAVAAGKSSGPCPDTKAADAISRATAKLRKALSGRPCFADAVQTAAFAGACEDALDADALGDCLLAEAAAVVDGAVEVAHAVTDAEIADGAARRCQNSVAAASGKYTEARTKLSARCGARADRGPGRGCDAADTIERNAEFVADFDAALSAACDDGDVATLHAASGFGGGCSGADTVAALLACTRSDLDGAVASIEALQAPAEFEQQATFEVAPGTALLRVTLNGSEERGTFFHLHLAHDREATTADLGSTLDSGFQAIEIVAPTAGTWQALVRPPGGAGRTLGAWQLTATSFP